MLIFYSKQVTKRQSKYSHLQIRFAETSSMDNLTKKIHQCNICPKRYYNNGTLYRHKQTHNSARNYKCDICAKTFQTDIVLYSHKKMHETPTLQCKECPQKNLYKGSLNIHLLVHTGIKPFKCKTCPQAFNNQGSLSHHRKIHEPDHIVCEVCSRIFKRVMHLKAHEKSRKKARN